MKLSIIIVNYNVRYFLANCLQSVVKACKDIESEIYVVDNNSTDQSVEMVQADFPEVKIIANDFNAGFSKANNQAIEASRGEYVLLLNPDTVVEESCFHKCIKYLDDQKDVGGLGVKMIDGSGKFLPESKRGLPTPGVAFYKISGFSRLFPRSTIFGKYHQGFLPENETNDIDVLSGAFMLMRREVLDTIGGLDESFFMYGEDIDMSYRIQKAGYRNVYFPEARIIHFKGESTKKSSVNYVRVFYRAMIIFAQKHFTNQNARTFSLLINMAIYFRAFLALINRFLVRIYMPCLDVGMLWALLFGVKNIYENYILEVPDYYPRDIELMAFPLLISCWIGGQLIFGGYHQPVKFKNVFKGLVTGALFAFILYAMLDESLRFSRAIVATSVGLTFFVLPLSRLALMKVGFFKLIRYTESNTALVGKKDEIERVKQILESSTERKKRLYYVNPEKRNAAAEVNEFDYSASLYQLKDAIRVFHIDEIIFCMGDVSCSDIFNLMEEKIVQNCNIYLHPARGNYLLRSSSNQSVGEYILPENKPEMKEWSKKKKKVFEIMASSALLILSPFFMFFFRKPWQFVQNMYRVLMGKSHMIGYPGENFSPYIVRAFHQDHQNQNQEKEKIDYLINYGIEKDLEILIAKFSQLDNQPAN